MCVRAWFLIVPVAALIGCGTPTPDVSDSAGTAEREFWSQPANRARLEAYVRANVTFSLLHEMGHYVFSEFNVPIAGREEDAADRLAGLLMTPVDAGSGPEAETTTSPNASDLIWVAYSWIRGGRRAEEPSRARIAWYDEHSIDEQRGYDVLCLAYGRNPARFALAVQDPEIGIPDARRLARCQADADRNASAFSRLVGALALNVDEFARRREAYLADWQARQKRTPNAGSRSGSASTAIVRGGAPPGGSMLLTNQPPGVFYENYEPAELWWSVPWFPWDSEAFLRRHEILETVRDSLLGLRQPSNAELPLVEAQSCGGDPNAFYGIDPRLMGNPAYKANVEKGLVVPGITICYPLVDAFSWEGRRLIWRSEQERLKNPKR